MSQQQSKKNDAITSQEEDFGKWYTDVCLKAELMNYSSVKGFINYLPYGYAIWETIKEYADKRFKEHGSSNVYLPMVIPESLFSKEKEHVEGFSPETLVATYGGGKELEEPLIIRPTSEILFSEVYKKIVSSYRDLPKIYNQWCSVVRWEKTTRPFLRGSEFLWQEGHCLFETEEEAKKNAEDMLEVYDEIGKNLLAIPFIKGEKSEHERFAGAVSTHTIEAMMPDGKALQSGTTHFLGQGFAKAYGIQYLGRNNKLEVPYQTSWGFSTRFLGSIIMVHGDDNGLVLPPYVAPIQVVIVPIRAEAPGVSEAATKLENELKALGIRVKTDLDSTRTPGWKFAQYEMKGVPLRIEIGPRDLAEGKAVLTKRVNGEKTQESLAELASKIPGILKDIHEAMYQKALAFQQAHIKEVSTIEELKEVLDEGNFAKMAYCGDPSCEDEIKALTNGGTCRCIIEEIDDGRVCPHCGHKAKYLAYFAKSY